MTTLTKKTVGRTECTGRDRLRIFGVDVDNLDLSECVQEIIRLAQDNKPHSVITTNLDHVLKLANDATFREAYQSASLVVADGAPFVLISRFDKTALKERVAGSDLISPVCAAAVREELKVLFLGSSLPRLAKAAKTLTALHPGLNIVGVYAPPLGFDKDAAAQKEASDWIDNTAPDIVMVALGAPKQELWSAKMIKTARQGVFLNIGAGLDFLSGEVVRAPALMQRTGTEWLYRALSEPTRLAPRYIKIVFSLPQLIRRHYAAKKNLT